MQGQLSEWFWELVEELASHPILFSFIVSVLGNSVPYMTTPYLLFIASYSAIVGSLEGRIGIALAGGVGAAIGKLVVYFIGRSAHHFLSEEAKKSMRKVSQVFNKSIFIAVFLFAALPLPDDVIYMPLGVMGYSVVRYFLAVVLGKIIITGLAVALGASISMFLGAAAGSTTLLAAAATAVVGIAASIIIARMDWNRVLEAYRSGGAWKAVRTVIEEAARGMRLGGTRSSSSR